MKLTREIRQAIDEIPTEVGEGQQQGNRTLIAFRNNDCVKVV